MKVYWLYCHNCGNSFKDEAEDLLDLSFTLCPYCKSNQIEYEGVEDDD